MPTFVTRPTGLQVQPSTHQLKFRSPVPRNPLLIPGFIERETSPLHHTHSQGDVTGAGAGASAALRGLFVSVKDTLAFSTTDHASVYFEVRDGLSVRASEMWMINPWTDSVTPPVRPRAAFLSAALVPKGEFFANNAGGDATRSRDFLLHTTAAGSAVVTYADKDAITVYLGVELISPTLIPGIMAFP